MKFLIRFLIICFTLGIGLQTAELTAQTRKVKKAEKQAEKKKAEQKRAYEISKKKDVQHRFDMQTPATKNRMKNSRKEAKRLNDQGHEPFLKRIFHRKRI